MGYDSRTGKVHCSVCLSTFAYQGDVGTDMVVFCTDCIKDRHDDVLRCEVEQKHYWQCSWTWLEDERMKEMCLNCEYADICDFEHKAI